MSENKIIILSNLNILLTIMKSNEILQDILIHRFSKYHFNGCLKIHMYTFWTTLTYKNYLSHYFINLLYNNVSNNIYIKDEESKFPLNKSIFNKKCFFYFFIKYKKHFLQLYCTLINILYFKKHLNEYLYKLYTININILNKISIYNYRTKINLISGSTQLIWAVVKACVNQFNVHVSIIDIKYLKKFSLTSGFGFIDTFIRILLKEYSKKTNKYPIKIARCLSTNFTMISKIFNIKIQTKFKDIFTNIEIIINIDKNFAKVYYLVFKIII